MGRERERWRKEEEGESGRRLRENWESDRAKRENGKEKSGVGCGGGESEGGGGEWRQREGRFSSGVLTAGSNKSMRYTGV